MSKSSRIELRERYMEGWYQMDLALLLETTAIEFIFDDPVEPQPVTRDSLKDYMLRWEQRANMAGGNNQWILTHVTRNDKDGVLIDWEWWQIVGTELQGAAIVLTGDSGVLLERITYFDRTTHSSQINDASPA